MSAITTHVLDTSIGRPASGVEVRLERRSAPTQWTGIGTGRTDGDGRLRTLLPESHSLEPGVYRITFEVGAYFERSGTPSFYPLVSIVFQVPRGDEHYHVPLLVSPFGYSTYRGS